MTTDAKMHAKILFDRLTRTGDMIRCNTCGAPATKFIPGTVSDIHTVDTCDLCAKDYTNLGEFQDLHYAATFRALVQALDLTWWYQQHRNLVLTETDGRSVPFLCIRCEHITHGAGDGCTHCGYGYEEEDGELVPVQETLRDPSKEVSPEVAEVFKRR